MTDRYAVIGHPVKHSKSPQIHTEFARQTGQDLTYGIVEAPLDGFVTAVKTFRAEGGKGMNVTENLDKARFQQVLSPVYAEFGKRFGQANIDRIRNYK